MPKLPISYKDFILSPHVVILGAGASVACCPKGDLNGKSMPVMDDFVDIVGLQDLLSENNIKYKNKNFHIKKLINSVKPVKYRHNAIFS